MSELSDAAVGATMQNVTLKLSDGVMVEVIGEEAVVYASTTKEVFTLSGSAAILLAHVKMQGRVTIQATPDISALVDRGLLSVVSGLTRRRIVTGALGAAGVTTVGLALPQVAAASSRLVAPTSRRGVGVWTYASGFYPVGDPATQIGFLALGNFVGDNFEGPTNLTADGLEAERQLWDSGIGALWAFPLDGPPDFDFTDDIVAGFAWSTQYEVTFSYVGEEEWWEDYLFPSGLPAIVTPE